MSEKTYTMVFEKESKSGFIDNVLKKLDERDFKKLNELTLEMFRITNLAERQLIDRTEIILNVKESIYRIDGYLRLKKGYRHNSRKY